MDLNLRPMATVRPSGPNDDQSPSPFPVMVGNQHGWACPRCAFQHVNENTVKLHMQNRNLYPDEGCKES